jgi:hypothetical protein
VPFVWKDHKFSATLLSNMNIFKQEDELNLLHDFTVYASLSINVHHLKSSTESGRSYKEQILNFNYFYIFK